MGHRFNRLSSRMNIVQRFVLLALFAWMFLAPPTGSSLVRAALVFTVNDPSDGAVLSSPLDNGVCETAPGNGDCTLRAAITKANHYPPGGVTIQIPALPPASFTSWAFHRLGRMTRTAATSTLPRT